jgi:hypothetical protein
MSDNIKKKYTDQELFDLVNSFNSLPDDEKVKHKIGQGYFKEAYQIPETDLVMKQARPSAAVYKGNGGAVDPSKEIIQDYIAQKQMSKHLPTETSMLVHQPGMNPVLLQQKLEALNGDNYDKRKYVSEIFRDMAEDRDIHGADLHEGNVTFDKSGHPKIIDTAAFYTHDDKMYDSLEHTRKNAIQRIAGQVNPRVYRQIVGALPLAGTAMALSSGDASAAAEELPSEIPVIGQAYDAIRSESAGSAQDDKEMIAEREAAANYTKSPARLDAIKKLSGGY